MPTYDFICKSCGHVEDDVYMPLKEYKESIQCPKCDEPMVHKIVNVSFGFGASIVRGNKYPGSKRGMRKMMEKRYAKRNKKLEALPPEQKEGMRKFFNKMGVRKTPPTEPMP